MIHDPLAIRDVAMVGVSQIGDSGGMELADGDLPSDIKGLKARIVAQRAARADTARVEDECHRLER